MSTEARDLHACFVRRYNGGNAPVVWESPTPTDLSTLDEAIEAFIAANPSTPSGDYIVCSVSGEVPRSEFAELTENARLFTVEQNPSTIT